MRRWKDGQKYLLHAHFEVMSLIPNGLQTLKRSHNSCGTDFEICSFSKTWSQVELLKSFQTLRTFEAYETSKCLW